MPSFIDFAKKNEDLTLEEKQTLGTIEKSVNQTASEIIKKSKEEIDEKMQGFENQLKELNKDGRLDTAIKDLSDFRSDLKELGKELENLKNKGIDINAKNPIFEAIDLMFDSQKFKDFLDGTTKKSGQFEIDLKDVSNIISLTGNYQGNVQTTQQTNVVVSLVNDRKAHVRDLMMVDEGDPAYPSMSFTQIYDLDRNAAAVSENGRLPKSSFKIKEEYANVSRIGTYLDVSKRLLKSRIYVRSFLMNRVPLWVRMAEDFQIMFGDGQGDNLKGITKYDGVKCVSKFITENVVEGSAGSVKTVSSYDDGKATVIEFKDPQDKIEEGQKITFASATDETLNKTFVIHKMNDRKIMIDKAYVAESNTSAITFTVKNDMFNSVDDPNIGDVINAILAIMTYGEYTPNTLALHPSTIFQAQTAKDTTGASLNLVTVVNGVKYIANRPIVETTAVPPGKYFAGDFVYGASLVDYTKLILEFAEDRESKLQNFVTVIAQEEVIMPVYNPFAFAYGSIEDVKNAIKATA